MNFSASRAAIQPDPRNVEAIYLMISSFYLKRDYAISFLFLFWLWRNGRKSVEHTCAGNGLSIPLILHISRCKHTRDTRVACPRLGDNVSLCISLDLTLDKSCCWI